MKINELLESFIQSSDNLCEYYKQEYISIINNFDDYIKYHGTDGANIIFDKIINITKDSLIDFVLSQEQSYRSMIDARNKLEEKIKKSSGLSY